MISLYDIDGAEPVFVWTGAPEAFLADNDGPSSTGRAARGFRW